MKFKIFFFTYLIFCFSETIKKFDVAIKVDEQRKTTIEETILYDSESLKRQGIIRFIPIKTKPPLKIKLLSVKDGNLVNHPYEVKNDGEFLTIKIGQAGKFFQGQNIYQITYECFNCWREFEDYLEFYWNVTGNDWDMWIEQSRAKIIFDKPTRVLQSVCFTGKRGSKDKDCQIRELENAVEIVSNRALSEGEGLTVAISVPKNVFKQPLIPESIKQFGTRNFLALALIVVGICLPLYAFFRILALGNRGAAIKVQDNPLIVQYEPPEGLLPLEAGHLINGRLNMEDIAGEIVNLATKGVIKITDTYREIPLLPDIPDVVLTRLTDDSSLDEAQKKLLNLFFGWKKEVSLYEASKNPGFGNRFRREFKDLERYLDKKMIKEGIFDQKKYSQLNNSRALVAFSFFITFFGVLIAGEDPPSLIVMGVAI